VDTERQILIRGGRVVTAEDTVRADLLIRGAYVAAMGLDLPATSDTDVVEADGLWVLPGVIDAHTHIQLDTGAYRTDDSWDTGSRAAALGGVTTVIDFATQFEGQSFESALEARLQEAAPSWVDYAFHMMVTDVPAGEEDRLSALPALGVQSIKLYTTYRPFYYMDDAALLRLLRAAQKYGLLTLVHCENDAIVTAKTEALVAAGNTGWRFHGDARPGLAEEEAAARVLFLAREVGAPVVIVHNSTARTSSLVVEARAQGQLAYAETAPQYLLLDDSRYAGEEPWRYILQPPLRSKTECEALWALLAAGAVDMVITDHCDYTRAQKLESDTFTKTPGGLPGLETLLPLMATYGVAKGRLDWPDLVRLLSRNPAQLYGLWPRKGVLRPGADADVVLYDPEPETIMTDEAIHMRAGYTPFQGMRVQGRVVSTLRRGAFLVRDGALVDPGDRGVFLRRSGGGSLRR
jgi:dihydropyrimidinase